MNICDFIVNNFKCTFCNGKLGNSKKNIAITYNCKCNNSNFIFSDNNFILFRFFHKKMEVCFIYYPDNKNNYFNYSQYFISDDLNHLITFKNEATNADEQLEELYFNLFLFKKYIDNLIFV